MRIAIIGKAGCGKTTFAKLLHQLEGYTVIHVDELVSKDYADHGSKLYAYIQNHFPFAISRDTRDIWKSILAKELSTNKKKREQLENYIYATIIFDIIHDKKNIIVDGVMPRFIDSSFDMVLYAHVNKLTRRCRLTGRGVSPERIKQIEKMQKNWINYLKD
jgi:dephospho-CoA kinase